MYKWDSKQDFVIYLSSAKKGVCPCRPDDKNLIFMT